MAVYDVSTLSTASLRPAVQKHWRTPHIIDLLREGQWSDYKQVDTFVQLNVKHFFSFSFTQTDLLPLSTVLRQVVRLSPPHTAQWTDNEQGDTLHRRQHSL